MVEKNSGYLYDFWNSRWQSAELPDYDKQRIQQIIDLLPWGEFEAVLDVGCGDGRVLNVVAERCAFAVGIDISEAGLKYVQTHCLVGGIDRLPFQKDSFDLVMCCQLFEHLKESELDLMIPELMRVSKKFIYVDVPYKENRELGLVRCDKCLSVFHGSLHLQSFSQEALKELMERYGCRAIKEDVCGITRYASPFLNRLNSFLTGYYSYWRPNLLCPICGNTAIERKRARENPLSAILVGMDLLLGKLIPSKPRYLHILFEC